MNARKMKRRIYQRHAHTLRTRKYARCLMTGNMEPILRPIVRAMVKRLIRPFLRTLEASAQAGESMSVLTVQSAESAASTGPTKAWGCRLITSR